MPGLRWNVNPDAGELTAPGLVLSPGAQNRQMSTGGTRALLHTNAAVRAIAASMIFPAQPSGSGDGAWGLRLQ